MADIRIWKTLTGAVILTPQAIGFGFFKDEELAQLQDDLEAGVPLNKAVGILSGSVYLLDRLRQVYHYENAKQVVIEWKELILHERDSFTFLTQQACREFYDALMDQLGPEFQSQAARAGCGTLLLGLGALLLSLIFLGTLLQEFVGKEMPGRPPLDGSAKAILAGIGLFFLLLAVFWFRKYFRRPAQVDPEKEI